MRLGLCTLNGTPIKSGTNANAMETITLCNQINKHEYCEIINTTDEAQAFNSVYVLEADPNSYDAIIIMNSQPNFFGGVRDDNTLNIYKFLAKTKCPLFYVIVDMGILFQQLWPCIRNRSWNDLTEEDVKIDSPFYVISQFNNLNTYILPEINKQIPCKGLVYNEFATWILEDYENKMVRNTSEYDLIYGGSFRSGRREQKFLDFFFNKDISVAVYGSMKPQQFKKLNSSDVQPTWLGRVACTDVVNTNAKGIATIIVGEKYYNNNTITLRIYESMLANCVVFIDEEFDTKHEILKDDFHYVRNGAQLQNRIKRLKEDPELRQKCLERQYEFLKQKSKIDHTLEIVEYIRRNINK